jgi:nitrogen fixation protein NifB
MRRIISVAQAEGCEGASMCPGQQLRVATAPALSPSPFPHPFPHLEGRHPCFSLSPEAHAQSGRLHLPVSPACNIFCAFCKRGFNARDQRPGVAHQLLHPAQAVAVVERALELCPEISVIGIAGPGDTLATDHAIETFEKIHAAYPGLINCLSTNGLLLAEKAERVVAAGVSTVTVTVNAVDAAIAARIVPRIAYRKKAVEGEEGTRILIANQLDGIRRVVAAGATVKVNTVLVPGINDNHVAQIAETVAAAGASLINIIPLIPQHHFSNMQAPDANTLHTARTTAGHHLTVFSHCQRCRADACGIPGISDFSEALYGIPPAAFTASTFSHG